MKPHSAYAALVGISFYGLENVREWQAGRTRLCVYDTAFTARHNPVSPDFTSPANAS